MAAGLPGLTLSAEELASLWLGDSDVREYWRRVDEVGGPQFSRPPTPLASRAAHSGRAPFVAIADTGVANPLDHRSRVRLDLPGSVDGLSLGRLHRAGAI